MFDMPGGSSSQAPPDLVGFIGRIGSRITRPVLPGAATITILGTNDTIRIPLDNMHCKNVVFSECELVYSGAPLILDNVVFQKCRLQFGDNIPCQLLAVSLLGEGASDLSIA